jgi:glutathione reductase (NADPH)
MTGPLSLDLVVLGGGSGGLAAAFRAAGHGARVALLEPGPLGGACVNAGCVPKKAMWLAADLAGRFALAEGLGFPPAAPRVDGPELVASRQGYIANIQASYRHRLDAAGVQVMRAKGRLLSADTVQCEEGTRLQAPHVLVATGSAPVRPDVPGVVLGIDSDGFFALASAPGRVAVIGGGYIAVELASTLQALGSHVEVFVRGQRLLEGFDEELAERLADNLAQAGIGLHFGYHLAALDGEPGAVRLRESGGDAGNPFDQVLFATGRRPVTTGLGLDAAGVALDPRGGIVVDAFQDTSTPGVHAVGDVTAQLPLTPVAIAQARRLMDRLFGGASGAHVDLGNVPTVVFTHPPLGMCGLTEAVARERFPDGIEVHRASFRPMLHALADVTRPSLFKLVCAGPERRVVGIHLLGEGADEILQGFAVALKLGVRLDDLHDTMAIHPTSAEELVLMG